jgi:hypothetical protein
VSVEQAFPSSQFSVPPPVWHLPVEHVFGLVQVLPEHEPAAHSFPSATGVHAVVDLVESHIWQVLAGSTLPFTWHTPPIRHRLAWRTLLHPVAATQVSVVQARRSSHDLVVPPSVQAPYLHVFAAVHVRPEHDAAWQVVPSATAVHAEVETDATQAWQGLAGSLAPSA